MGFFKKLIDVIGSIGADPSDSPQTRLLKRVYAITITLAAPLSAGIALAYLLLSQWRLSIFWLILASFSFVALFLLAVLRRNIETFAITTQTYLIVGSFAATWALGGLFRHDGVIFLGLVGVLYAMVFPSRKRAFFMFTLVIIKRI